MTDEDAPRGDVGSKEDAPRGDVVSREDAREVAALLGRLQRAEPHARRSARVRARCRAVLEKRARPGNVFEPALVACFSLVYFSVVLMVTLRASRILP
jgi:hypothetical protein